MNKIIQVCGVPPHSLWGQLAELWGSDSFVVSCYSEHGALITTVSSEPLATSQDLLLSLGTEALEERFLGRGYPNCALAPDVAPKVARFFPAHSYTHPTSGELIKIPEERVEFQYFGYIPGLDPDSEEPKEYVP